MDLRQSYNNQTSCAHQQWVLLDFAPLPPRAESEPMRKHILIIWWSEHVALGYVSVLSNVDHLFNGEILLFVYDSNIEIWTIISELLKASSSPGPSRANNYWQVHLGFSHNIVLLPFPLSNGCLALCLWLRYCMVHRDNSQYFRNSHVVTSDLW